MVTASIPRRAKSVAAIRSTRSRVVAAAFSRRVELYARFEWLDILDIANYSQIMRPRQTASLTIAGATVALGALAILHLVRPDVEPSSHMISEYAIGSHGYLMTLSFAAFAISSVSLFFALLRSARGVLGRVGHGFLLLAATGLAIGAAFATDPSTTNQEAMSYSGKMHGVGFMIGVPSQLLAALCLSLALRRRPAWAAVPLLTIALVVWAALAIMVPLLVQQRFFGIPNRVFMVTYGVWLILAARPLLQAGGTSTFREATALTDLNRGRH